MLSGAQTEPTRASGDRCRERRTAAYRIAGRRLPRRQVPSWSTIRVP
jgi:hypothetical protein